MNLVESFPPGAPSTSELLISGGDSRIQPGADGSNRYGAKSAPDPELAAFGSSTASSISGRAYAAADRLQSRLASGADYATEIERIKSELLDFCGLSDSPKIQVALAPSGTDLHRIAASIAARGETLLALTVDSSETGSGVHQALRAGGAGEVGAVRLRTVTGEARPANEIDAEFAALTDTACKAARRVLLVTADVSKSGMIAPSAEFAARLKNSYPIDVLVDACQFRLSRQSLRGYLDQGFMVAVTGSKFLAGPSFSGALLIPRDGRPAGSEAENAGMLLRWEAALCELAAFRGISDSVVTGILGQFAEAIRNRLANDPAFSPLPMPQLDRGPIGVDCWDRIPSLFPFLLRHPGTRQTLDARATERIYRLLQQDLRGFPEFSAIPPELARLRVQLGQPVFFGEDSNLSALRLAFSAPLVVEAAKAGTAGVIRRALSALDKTAYLAGNL